MPESSILLRKRVRRYIPAWFRRRLLRLAGRMGRIWYLHVRHKPPAYWPPWVHSSNPCTMRAKFETYLNDIQLRELLKLVEETEGLTGDLLECGAYKGGASTIIGLKLKSLGSHRKFHAVDSFEGLPEPTQHDHQDMYGRKAGDMKVDVEYVRDKTRRFGVEDYVFVYKGWLEEVLPHLDEILVNGPRWFSFVFVDCNLYEPTKACCQYLWDRLLPGGVMVFDDYELNRWPGVRRAVDEFFTGKPENPQPLCFPTWYVRKSASRS